MAIRRSKGCQTVVLKVERAETRELFAVLECDDLVVFQVQFGQTLHLRTIEIDMCYHITSSA
ncbi:hypothetical protein RRF57_010821 [Xylaria bambusicola]|uniref:Uncharacterized protein n=1 Tax=Xylaria bambusicola TaxID=326684 RepID=A0AAN7UVL1_9PEZI